MAESDSMKEAGTAFRAFARVQDFLLKNGYGVPEYIDGNSMSPLVGEKYRVRFTPTGGARLTDLRETLPALLGYAQNGFTVVGYEPTVIIDYAGVNQPNREDAESLSIMTAMLGMILGMQGGHLAVGTDGGTVVLSIDLQGCGNHQFHFPPDSAEVIGKAIIKAAENARNHK